MKLLTIGLDGGDKRIIEHMPMPFLQSLLAKSNTPKIEGDLFSRGWAEIYTGKKAVETGAAYTHPFLDGSFKFDLSFNYKRPQTVGFEPLWNTLNAAGTSVGFMNIPTTSPAQPVNGFFVGGAGGGINKVSGVPKIMCDTDETKAYLDEIGYIPDLRIGPGGVSTIFEMFDKIDEIVQRRRDAFLELVKRHSPDFGFLCYRTNTTVQYVAMSEIEAIIATSDLSNLNIDQGNQKPEFNAVQKRILKHYSLLDDVLKSIFEACDPKDYLFCADHGTSRYLYNANANAFLEKKGYLTPQMESLRPVRKLAAKVLRRSQKILPSFLKPKLRSGNLVPGVQLLPLNFNPRKTKAFGNWYVHGIYINDDDRFGGIVKQEEIAPLVKKICEDFNATEEAKKYKMKAAPFREKYSDSKWEREFPDIEIEKPDEMFFLGQGAFVSNNPNFGPIPENIVGLTDMNSGQKSRLPLFEASDGVSSLIRESDSLELTLVHDLIVRYFEAGEK